MAEFEVGWVFQGVKSGCLSEKHSNERFVAMSRRNISYVSLVARLDEKQARLMNGSLRQYLSEKVSE